MKTGHYLAGALAALLAAGVSTLLHAQAGTITGTIVSGDHGGPIPGAVVNALQTDRQTGALRTAVTDTAGSFSIGIAGAARPVVVARAEGHGFEMVSVPASGGTLRITLQKAGMISGVIRDAAGVPAPGLTVRIAYARSAIERLLPVEVHGGGLLSDRSGRYRVTGLKPGTLFVLQAVQDGAVKGESLPLSVTAGGTKTVDIVLGAIGALRGRVVDERGQPVGDAAVRFWSRRESDRQFHTTRNRMLSTTTGTDGAFAMAGVPIGNGTLMVGKPGFSQRRDTIPLAAVAAGSSMILTLKRPE